MTVNYDAILVLSFGGPEGKQDVLPFLENVLRGKNVPRERLLEVAEHYYHFDGVSPINQQNRELIDALRKELDEHGPALPIYWGNRNWKPMLADTLREMRDDGVKRCLAFVTSIFSSYSGCRQYREDVQRAQAEIGEGAPQVDKLRTFYNHPGFVEAMSIRLREAYEQISPERREAVQIVYTAHSIPEAMSAGCEYVDQLNESCRLTAEAVGCEDWTLVYQSRSGPPTQAWLEPDICDYLQQLHAAGKHRDVIIAPIGFISDHMEVLFDLDTEARELCERLDLNMVRAKTVGAHPVFTRMIRDLVAERIEGLDRPALGERGPSHDVCPQDCCASGRPARPAN